MKVGIRNHSSLSGAYCRFLIKNSANGDVRALKSKMKALEDKYADLVGKHEELKNKIRAVESVADKAFAKANKK